MTERTPADRSDASIRRLPRGPTRREFLGRTAAAGAVAAGVSTTAVDTAAARGIETPRLERDGNLIVDPDGRRVVLRGVNVIDPARAGGVEAEIDAATDEETWYARVIRLPMQPQDIAAAGGPGAEPDPGELTVDELEAYLSTYVDPAVERCAERGAYVILDYHRHWDPAEGAGVEWTHPNLGAELELFWETVAPRYAEESHVLYEVYNEPNRPFHGGDITDPEAEAYWRDWKDVAQPWVDTIREHADNLTIVGSPQWSQYTYWAPRDEFEGENLAYTAHIYAQEHARPLSTYFGEPSREVPVFMTEFGFDPRPGADDHVAGSREEHGREFAEFFEEYETVHWQAWCFHDSWAPPMLGGGFEPGNEWGAWVRDRLYERREDAFEAVEDRDVIEVGEYEARDTDGDGLHEDVNGDGTASQQDVAAYFEHLESDAIQGNPDAFNFDGEGGVGFDDIVALFRTV